MKIEGSPEEIAQFCKLIGRQIKTQTGTPLEILADNAATLGNAEAQAKALQQSAFYSLANLAAQTSNDKPPYGYYGGQRIMATKL